MTATSGTTARLPLPDSDADPFALDIREDPLPLHRELRESGPVVYLAKYDVYALARYEQVHAALTDWQRFQSGAGVRLANFRYEKPRRPKSLLIEADPPQHDAPRRVLATILNARSLRRYREHWANAANALVAEVLASGQDANAVDAVTSLAEAFPLRVFPDAIGIGQAGRENLLPYGDHNFNAMCPHNELFARGKSRAPGLLALG